MSNSFVKSELKSDNFDSKEIFLGKHCQEGYCQYTDNIYKCKEVVRMQKLMSEAHKSELAGIIAVGLAHDFNNMLCVANCKIEQILCKNGHDQYLKQKLEDVLFVLKQSSNLVRDLLVFCKKGETQDVILDVNVTIQKTVEILKKTFAKDIIFNLNFANDLPKILINETKFIQVLFNISLNASDAMPNGGKIEISTNRCH